ncbi:MAG: NADPH-dependent oxidoreductase [Bacteroidales bacterium]|nr:NADPH-dependent oxidoreductase [Bacteroidales bacterium]
MVESVFNHRSIRKYKSQKIDDKALDLILRAASRASTTGNMQVYSIVVTKDEAIKEKLWEAHFKQDMVKQAPVVLTFLADFNRFNKWCEQNDAIPGYDNFLSFYTASIDALLAAQNAAIQAEDLGLGICYLGTTTYMAQKIIETLNLPKGVVPVTTLVIGYPAELPGLTDRLPMEAIIHKETYQDFEASSIEKLYYDKDHSELTKKLLEENQKETLAQIFTDNRYTKKDNVTFSKLLLEVLKRQGFMNNEMEE